MSTFSTTGPCAVNWTVRWKLTFGMSTCAAARAWRREGGGEDCQQGSDEDSAEHDPRSTVPKALTTVQRTPVKLS